MNLKSFNRGGGFRYDGMKYFNGVVNEEQLLKQGDIVVAVTDMTTDRAVISRPARIPNIQSEKITFSADVVKIVPEKLPLSYLYYSLLDYRFTETTKNKANGANVLHLKPQAISEYKIIVSMKELQERFDLACGASLKLIDKLSEENEKLTMIRDLLIPQLVDWEKEIKYMIDLIKSILPAWSMIIIILGLAFLILTRKAWNKVINDAAIKIRSKLFNLDRKGEERQNNIKDISPKEVQNLKELYKKLGIKKVDDIYLILEQSKKVIQHSTTQQSTLFGLWKFYMFSFLNLFLVPGQR